MDAFVWLVSTDIYLLRILLISHSYLNVLWQIHHNRTRSSGSCNVKCLLDDPSQILSLSHGYGIFADISGDPDDINLLEGIISHEPQRHLSGKAD